MTNSRSSMSWDKHNRVWHVVVDGHTIGSYANKTIAEREQRDYLAALERWEKEGGAMSAR